MNQKRAKLVKKIVAISGRISSGKTTLAKQLASKYNLPVASFGNYIRNYCQKNHMPIDRATLQNVGNGFIKENPRKFLREVVKMQKGHECIILDGIRHRVIIKHLPAMCEKNMVIFVDADPKTIYERYVVREKSADMEKEYDTFDNHPVEFEIEQLKLLSDFIFFQEGQRNEMYKQIDEFINESHNPIS